MNQGLKGTNLLRYANSLGPMLRFGSDKRLDASYAVWM